MAPRTKRRRPARHRPRPTRPLPPLAATPGAAPQAARPVGRTGGGESLVRAVEMSLAPRGAGAGRRQRGMVLAADPAIPLDRVPYFTSDLAKLGIVASRMLVLLPDGSRLIPILLPQRPAPTPPIPGPRE